jgi:Endosomal/lysosomal potassium channel TMEM175
VDGVVAILITIMVLELKLPGEVFSQGLADAVIAEFGPKLVVHALSLLVIAIMLLNHPMLMCRPPISSRNSWPGPTHGERMNRWRGDSGGNSQDKLDPGFRTVFTPPQFHLTPQAGRAKKGRARYARLL